MAVSRFLGYDRRTQPLDVIVEAAMQKAKPGLRDNFAADRRRKSPVVPREYAGKWVAWSADGRRIVAVSGSFKACEQAAARAGLSADQVAIERIPQSRQRLTGSGM